MSYCSLSPIDHGLIEFPTQCYGGFAYRANTLEKQTTASETTPITDPTKRFITEHNIALFWRRPGLYPRAKAFPIPLHKLSDDYAKGARNRPPGNLRVDCAPIRYRRRNLLAGTSFQEDQEDTIRIWAINDSSDHKQLLQYDFHFSGDPFTCGRNDLLYLERRGEEFDRMDLSREVLQLRTFEGFSERNSMVFMRTKQSLELADTKKHMLSTIFGSQIHTFTQIPHLEGELVVVDGQGLLFYGQIDGGPSTFARYKCPMLLKDVCPTDCPRILLTIGDEELRQVDLREPNCPGLLLFSRSPINPANALFPESIYARQTSRDKFCHIHPLETELDSVLVTSTRRHTLIDRRMPGLPLLSMSHAEIDGADYCIMTPAFIDPGTNGRVFSFYSLTQVKKPVLSHWALMYHSVEGLYSSLGPKYELDSPHTAISQFVQLHVDAPQIKKIQLPKLTRAIHYQQLDSNLPISSTRAILFRQTEGGELWYENVFFDPLHKLRQGVEEEEAAIAEKDDYEGNYGVKAIDEAKLLKESLKQIVKYQRKEEERQAEDPHSQMPHFFREAQEELLVADLKQSKNMQKLDITSMRVASEFALSNGFQQPTDPIQSNHFANHHRISRQNIYDFGQFEHFDAEETERGSGELFTISLINIWQKTLDLWRTAKEKRMQKELGLMDIGGDEESEEWGKNKERGKKGSKREQRKRRRKSFSSVREGEDGGEMECGMKNGNEEEDGRMWKSGKGREKEEDEYDFEVDPDAEGKKPVELVERTGEEGEVEDEYNFDVDIDG